MPWPEDEVRGYKLFVADGLPRVLCEKCGLEMADHGTGHTVCATCTHGENFSRSSKAAREIIERNQRGLHDAAS